MSKPPESLQDIVTAFSRKQSDKRRDARYARERAASRARLAEIMNRTTTIIAPRIEGDGFLVWVANGPPEYREQRHMPTIEEARSLAAELSAATNTKIDDWIARPL